MKRIVACILVLIITAVPLGSCSGKPPALEEIYDRVVFLIEQSHEINEIFFGAGLPTYPRITPLSDSDLTYSEKYKLYYTLFSDDKIGRMCMYYDNETREYRFARVVPEDELTGGEGEYIFRFEDLRVYLFPVEYEMPEIEYVYDDETDDRNYNVVRSDAPYLSIEQIKEASQKVYSQEYLTGIYEAAFDGIASYSAGSLGVIPARFIEQGMLLRQHKNVESLLQGRRIYDFSTMKIVRPSGSKYINITVDSRLEGSDEVLSVRLSLLLQDGQWFLNSPTY